MFLIFLRHWFYFYRSCFFFRPSRQSPLRKILNLSSWVLFINSLLYFLICLASTFKSLLPFFLQFPLTTLFWFYLVPTFQTIFLTFAHQPKNILCERQFDPVALGRLENAILFVFLKLTKLMWTAVVFTAPTTACPNLPGTWFWPLAAEYSTIVPP